MPADISTRARHQPYYFLFLVAREHPCNIIFIRRGQRNRSERGWRPQQLHRPGCQHIPVLRRDEFKDALPHVDGRRDIRSKPCLHSNHVDPSDKEHKLIPLPSPSPSPSPSPLLLLLAMPWPWPWPKAVHRRVVCSCTMRCCCGRCCLRKHHRPRLCWHRRHVHEIQPLDNRAQYLQRFPVIRSRRRRVGLYIYQAAVLVVHSVAPVQVEHSGTPLKQVAPVRCAWGTRCSGSATTTANAACFR